VSSLFVALG